MKTTRRNWIASLALIPWCHASCRDREVPGAQAGVPVQEKPGYPVKGDQTDSDKAFVGLTEAAGADLAKRRGLKHRTVSIDGRLLPTTRDYRRDRVNFEIEQGRIARVSRG